MNNDSQKRTQSVTVGIVIIVVIVVVAVLGFVILGRGPTSEKSGTEQNTANQSRTYETSEYSFQSPKDGWVLSETEYNTGSNDGIVPTAKITTELGVEAEVSVYTTAATQTLAELKSEVVAGGDAQNILDTEVGGVPAFSYISTFEGVRYHTVFISNNLVYDIIYKYAGEGRPEKYIDGYNDIVASFSFK